MEITEYTSANYVKFIESSERFDAIEELAKVFTDTPVCTSIATLIRALKERERIMSTGIGFGIAIPHAKIQQVKKISFAIGISKKGVDFNSMDGKPVHLIILVAAGEDQHKHYLSLMSNIMTLLKNDEAKEKIVNCNSADEVIEIFGE